MAGRVNHAESFMLCLQNLCFFKISIKAGGDAAHQPPPPSLLALLIRICLILSYKTRCIFCNLLCVLSYNCVTSVLHYSDEILVKIVTRFEDYSLLGYDTMLTGHMPEGCNVHQQFCETSNHMVPYFSTL
jgi:hypothetical protein